MAALADGQMYEAYRADTLAMIRHLKKECAFKSIFYAGQEIDTERGFEQPDLSLVQNLVALRASKFFVMLYPSELVSSVLVEAGWAIAHEKPSVYFVRDADDLPFLLRQAGQALPFARVYSYSDAEDLRKIISNHRADLFKA